MKKIISITLAGKMYYFEENAFHTIDSVLNKQIKRQQLEREISEAIDKKLNNLKTVVTYADVTDILANLSDTSSYQYNQEEYTYKRLYRNRTQKILGGVCGGIAKYLNTDVSLIRLFFVLGTFFVGSAILIYLVLWLVIPEELN